MKEESLLKANRWSCQSVETSAMQYEKSRDLINHWLGGHQMHRKTNVPKFCTLI
jgi:hypothetical protein